MAEQQRVLRLLPCLGCDHIRASHYLFTPYDGDRRPHNSRPRDRSTPLACHVRRCTCPGFTGDPQRFLCPVCPRVYSGRSSLEIHFYGRHPGLSVRERSALLQQAVFQQAAPEESPEELPAPDSDLASPAES